MLDGGGDGGASGGGESVGASEAPASTTPASTTPAADASAEVEASAEAPAVEESVPEPVEPARDEKPGRKQSRQENRSLLKKALAALQFRKQARLGKVEALAKQKGSITNDDVQLALRVSDSTATRYLSELTKQGKLKMVGNDGSSRYEPGR